MNKDMNKGINVNDIKFGVVSNGIAAPRACGPFERGDAALKRQVQDDNGGPKNSSS